MRANNLKSVILPAILVAVLAAVVVWQFAIPSRDEVVTVENEGLDSREPVLGGTLVATYRTEPTNYNRLAGDLTPDELVALLTQDSLIRINRTTGELEPRLAEAWSSTADGLSWTLSLREGVTYSDGAPFTAADVAFTLEALYDPRVASALASSTRIDGQPVGWRVLDDHTIVVTLPAPYGPGLAILAAVPILPKHKLEAALVAGTFREAWRAGTPVSEVAGLGPFVLTEHRSGERLTFARNPRFWGSDDAGRRLPYLDGIELQIIPDVNAEILQLESGAVDLVSDRIRAEDVTALERRAEAGQLRLVEAGVSPNANGLWFNLGGAATADRPWLRSESFRRAVSHAVDRQAIVDTVYLGEARPVYGPITDGFGDWKADDLPETPHDPSRARALLAEAGLSDADGDGMLDDAAGRPARFSIVSQQGNDERSRAVTLIQAHLREVGVDVGIQLVDVQTIIGRYGSADYDAIYFGVDATGGDPAGLAPFWLSSGGMHFWNPGQAEPATDWEATIDDLFRRQMTALDAAERHRLFAEAQRVLARHLPIIHFAAPTVTIAMGARVGGARPSVFVPPVLWNAERLFVTAPAAGASGR